MIEYLVFLCFQCLILLFSFSRKQILQHDTAVIPTNAGTFVNNFELSCLQLFNYIISLINFFANMQYSFIIAVMLGQAPAPLPGINSPNSNYQSSFEKFLHERLESHNCVIMFNKLRFIGNDLF